VEKRGGLAMEVEQASAGAASMVGLGVECFFHDGDAGASGEFADCFGEREVFVFADEGDGVAALFAAEAMERLAGGIDGEGWCFFVVERAQALVVRAHALELDIGTDQVGQVGCGQNLFYGFLGDLGHAGIEAGNGNFGMTNCGRIAAGMDCG